MPSTKEADHQELAKENAVLRKENVRHEKNHRAKDIFLANLAHELKTPMTAILCWTQTLKSQLDDKEILNKAIEEIEENALLQNRLINELLDISTVISGKISIQLKETDLIPIIQSSIESVMADTKKKNIHLELTTNIPSWVSLLDADRMRQVFYNLVSNAIKFTPKGGKIAIIVTEQQNKLQIEVKDNGVGIAPEILPHIFEQFAQGAPHTKSGLGLGLALVNNFIQLHEGHITASSPGVNKGASFIIELHKKSNRLSLV